MRPSPRKICALLLALCLAVVSLCTSLTVAICASPDEGGRVPYRFHFETLHTTSGGGSIIQVFRDLQLELGQSLEAAGWMATAEGVSAYQYLWLPAGGGFGEWTTVKNPHIAPRKDLTASDIEYPSGHSTAGFTLSITPPEDTPEGYYDLYIRALDGMGTPCDLAALLNLRYGDPDLVSASGQTVSIPRIEREGEVSLLGGATVDGGQLRIPPDGRVRLGNLNLASFEAAKITYVFPDLNAVKGDKTSILGLKSGGEYSYGKDSESYNTTDSLVYAPLTTRAGEVTLKLDTCDENGEIWLTGHLNGDILISSIEFVANGYSTHRVAARIHFSEALTSYFNGSNRTELKGFTDPVLGDVLRMEVTEETNDPYVFFNAGGLLKEHDILLDANEYQYMVLLYRSYADNPTDHMHLYLCSGSITGATEECNHGVVLQRDGKWHYLLIDLTQRANWGGIIHGWRFDYLGNSLPGQGIDVASVQFFRTFKAANAAAKQDPAKATPFRAGDDPVIRDMSEEQDMGDTDFVLDPADTYEVTEPPAEPPTEPPVDPTPSDTEAPDSETTPSSDETQEAPAKRGCSSAVSSLSLLTLLSPLPLWLKKKDSYPPRRKIMKRNLRIAVSILSLVLALAMLASAWVTPALAAPPAEKLSDEQDRKTSEITLADGTKTGVLWSDISVSGSVYGADRQVNMVEIDLSNTHLSMEVLTGGQYMVSTKTLNKAAADYNASHKGQTVLAAVNGDLWMTAVHSGSSVSKKVLKVTRGILMIDGEIWASQQIDQENLGATNAEKNTPAGNKAAFGVTSKNQPLVGSPDIRVTMTVNGKEVKADGINRLPALNALIVYNHRVNDTNYALNDAYEVELEVDKTSAFKAGGELTAKVVAIYKPGAATRPAIGSKTIVLTARGNRVADLQNNFKVGDTVTFKTTLTDRMGRSELWQDVQDAIGGHMQPIVDGKLAVANGDSTAYPASFVGYRDDGTVVLCSMTSTIDGSRAGLRFKDGYKFCTEMGFNSVFYLDGGGSCTFLTLDEGSYTIRNQCSDGSPRAVINGIGVVWNETPVCDKQGSLSYIKTAVDMSAIPATYLDGALINELIGGQNAVNTGYDETEKAFKMTTATATNDPYASLDFGALAPASADTYKYIVFKVKTDHTNPNTTLMLFYAAGADNGAAAGRTKAVSVKSGMDGWCYAVADMSKVGNWKGNINNIRLDIFDSLNTPADVSMYFGAIVLCKTAEEAAKVADGWAPEGSITDYLAYLESLKPETEPETEAPTEPETEAPTEPETEAPTEMPTEAPTAAPTEPVTEALTAAPTEEPTEPAKSGCGSAVTFGLAAVLVAAAVMVIRKKD